MAMPSWPAMLNSQLFLLSGAANLAAGKLFRIENLAEIRVGKIGKLIMPSWTCSDVEQPALPLVWRGKPY